MEKSWDDKSWEENCWWLAKLSKRFSAGVEQLSEANCTICPHFFECKS